MTEIISINDATYTVRVAGQGDPILMLHGFTGTGETWQPVLDALSAHYRLIMPDLLGHGGTDAPTDAERYGMAYAAADLIAILDHLKFERVHLMGYSMGGRLALYTAVHHPARIRSLTLESSSPGLQTAHEREERRERDNALADRIEREGIPAFVAFWGSLSLWDSQQTTLDADAKARLRAERLSQRSLGLANSLRGMGTGVQPSLWDSLADLHLPVQLIAGALDSKFTAINQQMHAALPVAQLAIIPHAGHTPHLENPGAFARTVHTFLTAQTG